MGNQPSHPGGTRRGGDQGTPSASTRGRDAGRQQQQRNVHGEGNDESSDPALERQRSGLAPDVSQAPKPGGEE